MNEMISLSTSMTSMQISRESQECIITLSLKMAAPYLNGNALAF